jgi:hypothetical protein
VSQSSVASTEYDEGELMTSTFIRSPAVAVYCGPNELIKKIDENVRDSNGESCCPFTDIEPEPHNTFTVSVFTVVGYDSARQVEYTFLQKRKERDTEKLPVIFSAPLSGPRQLG